MWAVAGCGVAGRRMGYEMAGRKGDQVRTHETARKWRLRARDLPRPDGQSTYVLVGEDNIHTYPYHNIIVIAGQRERWPLI